MTERATVRFGIPTLLLAVQLALFFFYAALLLLVPLVRAIASGELPVELSLKGARWSEDIDGLGREGENGS